MSIREQIEVPDDKYSHSNALRIHDGLLKQACEDLERMYGRDCSGVTEAQRAAYSARTGTDIILNDIPGVLRSEVLGLAYIVFGGGAEALSKIGNINPLLARRIVLFISVPEACLAVVGCLYWFQREPNLSYLLVLTVVYFFLVSAGAEAYSRFRVPVCPCMRCLSEAA